MTVVPLHAPVVRTGRSATQGRQLDLRSLRPTGTQAVGIAAAAALVTWLVWKVPDLSTLTLPTITSWWWTPVALLACAMSFWASATVVLAASPVRVGIGAAAATQLAAAATKLMAPASVGLVGLNARLLRRHGASTATALASVAATQLAQLVVTLAALAVIGPLAGDLIPVRLPAGAGWWVGAIVLAGAGTAVVAARFERAAALRTKLADAVRSLTFLRSPARAARLVVGSLALTASLAACLWASVNALGGSAAPLAVVVVLLVGSALGSLVPTPGGLGGVEGAMVAGLVATGSAADVAVPAVLLFRLVTFWLPVPFGAVALAWLGRTGRI